MDPSPLFVGRHRELEALTDVLRQAAGGTGRVVFVQGGVGSGKGTFLDAFQKRAVTIPGLEATRFAAARCYSLSGVQSAYQPFVELIDELYSSSRRQKDKGKKLLAIVKEMGPDWLKLIPGVGEALSVGFKTASRVGEQFFGSGHDASAQLSKVLAAQYVKMITALASPTEPVCLMIRAAQWIDEVSCELLLRLAYRLADRPIVVILAFRPGYISKNHPLDKVRSEIRAKHHPVILNMNPFEEPEIDRYVRARFGRSLHPHLACWLFQLCRGQPLFIVQYLHLLEQTGVICKDQQGFRLNGRIGKVGHRCEPAGDLADLPVPSDVRQVIEKRLERLNAKEHDLLEIGAVQGEHFLSVVLAKLGRQDERDVLKQLRRVVDQVGVVRYHTDDRWMRARSQAYAFEHLLTRQTIYEQLGPAEKVWYHRDVAQVLKGLLKEPRNRTRPLLVELARHYELGEKSFEAAKFHYLAARAVFAAGAYGEAIALCRSGLDNARRVKVGSTTSDKLLANIIVLLLRATEIRWHGKPAQEDRLPVTALIDEARKAAARAGDRALAAQVAFMKGVAYVSTASLPEAIRALEQALAGARAAGDDVLAFSILSFLGHQTVGVDLNKGVDLQYRALKQYRDRIAGTPKDKKRRGLRLARFRLSGYIGVAEFDRGRYDVAEKKLKECVAGLRQLQLSEHLVTPLNFLSQLYIAMGRFAEAETLLEESIALLQDDPEDNPWRAYNRALLGKLFLEQGRVDAAADPLTAGWREAQAAGNKWLMPLVRNYLAEWHMHSDSDKRNLEKAQDLLAETIREAKQTGFYRSLIWALSQMGCLKLAQDNLSAALQYSTKAIDILEKIGTMPALRVEEIYYNHFVVLSATKDSDGAARYCRQAGEAVRQKAASITGSADRQRFLDDVPLNRSIVSAYRQLA